MKLLFFTEARLEQTEDGRFYSADHSFSYQLFKRYLSIFDKVLVVARVFLVAQRQQPFDESTRVDNSGVAVLPLPYYIGPYQYLIMKNKLHDSLHRYIDLHPDAAVICRVPGVIGAIAVKYLTKKNRPYGLEIVGDPIDVFAPGSFNHPFRAVFRYSGTRDLKRVVKGAVATIYVTKNFLQSRYPPGENAYSTYASDVILRSDAFAVHPKVMKNQPPYLLISVGSLSAMYKSPDVAIKAIARLKKRGMDLSLRWIGGGKHIKEMKELAHRTGVGDNVCFIGNVGSPSEIIRHLDESDLFVIPSRTEGLPRALVEAMARGLPCIGSSIGGIPELLDKTALVPLNQPQLLANKIYEFLTNSNLADLHADRNLKHARNYEYDLLEAKRIEFYKYLKVYRTV